jgi:transposase-like protein
MVTVTKIFTCRVCRSNNLIKKGYEKNGNPRVKCKDCNSVRVAELKPVYTEERKAEIIKAYQERASLRGVSRIYGVAKQTLSDWIKKNS